MLLIIPPPAAASALVDGTFGPSLPGTKPNWLGAGVLEPDPVPVPLLEEYKEPGAPPLPFLRRTEERLRLKAVLALNLFRAEKALVMVPELSTDMSTDAGVGAEEAR